jgi:hypothetical protein
MTWFGKIMTFFVFCGVLTWMYMTVTVYVTRTNWKVRSDNYEKAYKESEAFRSEEARLAQAKEQRLAAIAAAEKTRADDLSKMLEDLAAASKKGDDEYRKLLDDYRNADVQAKIVIASQTTTLNELDNTRKRNAVLEDNAVKLVLAKETADRERLRAENEKKLAQAIADDNARRVETLTALVTELRQTGGSGTATVLRSIDKVAPPLPENIRGTVLRDIAGDFVHISIGIDAGLQPGSKLDVYRDTGTGQYLGTLIVTSQVYPKEAIAEFRPARGVPTSQLRPDELPKKNDKVGYISTSAATIKR